MSTTAVDQESVFPRPTQGQDAWKKIQQRTFTNWFNDRLRGHLKVAKRQIKDLETDLQDGLLLLDLLEKLVPDKKIGRYNQNPKIRVQHIENLGTAIRFIKAQNIKLVNIGKYITMNLPLGLLQNLEFGCELFECEKCMCTAGGSICIQICHHPCCCLVDLHECHTQIINKSPYLN